MKLITQQILNLFIGRTLTPQAKSPVTRGLWLVLPVLVFTGLTAPAIDYPPISSFLYGNTGVNAPAQTNAVSGDGYPYRLLLPPNYNPATHYPLIVYLHGGGEVGRDNVRQLTAGRNTANGGLALVSTENQSNYPCLFAAPQMSSNSWYYAPSVQAVSNLIVLLETQYSVDTNRICLTGLSSGGIGSWCLPPQINPNPFSCIVPLSGFSRYPDSTPKIPIWDFHAANDPTESIKFGNPRGMRVAGEHGSDDIVPHLRDLGFPVIYTRYNTGGHAIWSMAYQNPLLLPWMFAQRLGQPLQGVPGLEITASSQSSSNLTLSGTVTSAAGFTRVGWTSNFKTPSEQKSDGVADGSSAALVSASSSFDSKSVGQRVGILPRNADQGAVYYDIVAVQNSNTVTLSATLSAGTYSFITYPYGTPQNPYPAEGSISPNWKLADIPLSVGTNLIQVIAEAPSGVSSYGGLTTINRQFVVTYVGEASSPPVRK